MVKLESGPHEHIPRFAERFTRISQVGDWPGSWICDRSLAEVKFRIKYLNEIPSISQHA